MSDPRAAVGLSNPTAQYKTQTYPIDNSTITYSATEANGSAQVDLAVTLTTSETIALVGDGEQVEGKLISVESDGFCVVQISGRMTLPGGSGATLTNGKQIVGDLGAASAKGYIREVATAVAAELGVSRGRILDPTTTTAVVVEL